MADEIIFIGSSSGMATKSCSSARKSVQHRDPHRLEKNGLLAPTDQATLSGQMTDDIVVLDQSPSKRKAISPMLTPAIAKAMRRTLIHPLPVRCESVSYPAYDLRENNDVIPDGKVKPLKRIAVNGREELGMRVDGTEYWVKDAVEVRVAEGIRSGVIWGISQRHKRFHVQWLKVLNVGKRYDQGGVQEYFLEDAQCDDISINHIVGKMTFNVIMPGKPIDPDGKFCRFVAQSDHRLRDIATSNGCDSCHRRQQLASADELHQDDFVMIDPGVTGMPYIIGQIYDLYNLEVRVFERYTAQTVCDFKDETRLSLTSIVRTVQRKDILGRCTVVNQEKDISKHDISPSFWCPEVSSLRQCQQCKETRQTHLKRCRAFKSGLLKAADYYSGAGGGILSAMPFFHVSSAVEMNPIACSTLWGNFAHLDPPMSICMERLEHLHRRELQRDQGGRITEVYQLQDPKKTVPYLPAKSTIAVMMGGIPCQGHSRANAFQKADDDRNYELFYFMSEVSRVKPGYVVLENVPGFKDSKNDTFDPRVTGNSFAGVAIDLLLAEGYQCHLATLDSRAYGSPQNRTRLWIVAALSGSIMPEFPQPTHANPLAKASVFSFDSEKITGCYVEKGTVGTGPFPAITARDALGDLPYFEFELSGARKRQNIPMLNARLQGILDTKIGFAGPVPYRTAPQTKYQKLMRGQREKIKYHYTPSRGPIEIEKCHRAFEIDERDLHADETGSERKLNPDEGIYTLLTRNGPGQRANRPIHYDQRRTKTVAEDKRAMGFPDDYHLSGTAKEQIAQMGNAWVVPMGTAILRSIRDAIRQEWIAAGEPKNVERWFLDRLSSLTK